MNVIFLTMSRVWDITRRGIYSDLMRRFRDEGHRVFIVTPFERSIGKATSLVEQNGVYILGVKTLNLQKTTIIEKGIGQILVEGQYKKAIRQYLADIHFDLILFSTPPITLSKVIVYLRDHNPDAKAYLLLKDIFPQNAVDIGIMKSKGIRSLLYRFFRNKEKKLYNLADYIGCMSPANVKYILNNNPFIPEDRVEVSPNSLELQKREPQQSVIIERLYYRQKYGLPQDRPIFVYGGNLGKPQDIPFVIDCLDANANREDCFFIIIGTGTELPRLKKWYAEKQPKSVVVKDGIPKNEYDSLLKACDVGLIFLDHRFTIPNYPSRILSYLENRMPVLCATDSNTDIGRIAEENGYGYWCESNSVDAFTIMLNKMVNSDFHAMGDKGYAYLKANYLVDNTYNAIIKHV